MRVWQSELGLVWLRIAWQYSRLYGFPNFSLCNVSPLWGSYVSVLGFLLLSRVLQFVQTVKLIYRKQTPLGFWEELDIDGWISLFTHCYKRYSKLFHVIGLMKENENLSEFGLPWKVWYSYRALHLPSPPYTPKKNPSTPKQNYFYTIRET